MYWMFRIVKAHMGEDETTDLDDQDKDKCCHHFGSKFPPVRVARNSIEVHDFN